MALESMYPYASPDDIRVTMQEEGCARCFGCSRATGAAELLTQASNKSFETSVRISETRLHLVPDPLAHLNAMTLDAEQLQKESRIRLHTLTQNCIGWLDGAERGVSRRPRMMCNSPESKDSVASYAVGLLFERVFRKITKS